MFDKFKSMILDALAGSKARHDFHQEELQSLFKVRTPEEIAAENEKVNAMMRQSPEEILAGVDKINAGLAPSYDQIINQKKQADAEAIMLRTGIIKKEIEGFSEKDQNRMVLGALAENFRTKAESAIGNIREKAMGLIPTKKHEPK